jgi:hypothetical protein
MVHSLGILSLVGTPFQLAVSPFNWIDNVMEKVDERVGRNAKRRRFS